MGMQQVIPDEGQHCEACGIPLSEFDIAYRCDECGAIQCSRCSEPDEAPEFELPVVAGERIDLKGDVHLANRRRASWN